MSPAEQEALREQAIAMIDQRISSIQLQQRFTIDRRFGSNDEFVDLSNSDFKHKQNMVEFGHDSFLLMGKRS